MGRSAALLVALAACGGGAKSTAPTTPAEPAAVTTAGTAAAAGASRIDVLAPATCAAGASCEASLVVHALGDFKVNADYPTKFVPDPASTAVEPAGQFVVADKRGTLTLKFTGATPGPTKIAGTFKFSVCTEDVCNIEEPKIAFEVR